MKRVQAIFDCKNKNEDKYGNCGCFLEATTNGDDWPDFTKYTPFGEISLGMDESASAREFFEEGATYRVTFEKVEE